MGLHTYLELKSVPKNIARILICYDALLQLRQKKVKAEKGKYVVVRNKGTHKYYDPAISLTRQRNLQIDSVLDKQQCQACALGTLFISRARIFNKIKICDIPNLQFGQISYDDRNSISALNIQLQQYFDARQLSLIEACFEGETVGVAGGALRSDELVQKISARYITKYKTAESRLIAILKNIISNDGLFIPEKNLSRSRKKKTPAIKIPVS